jgi:NAD(P)-dependent dehydrogenase (short-subunit alcohol dehydrogenase family)
MKKKVIVYGGYGAIGSAIAQRMAGQDWSVHLVGRDPERLREAASALDATYTQGDVTDGGTFERVANDAGDHVSALVYAIGTIRLRGLGRLGSKDFLDDFTINAMGAAQAVQAAQPALKRSEGRSSVVFFSSIAALQGFSLHASMGMAKGAVNGLTLALAAELAPEVRVNAIAPSLTRTPLADGILANQQMAETIAGLHPLPRLGTAEDAAALASFLLSPDSDWITGQVLPLDGGRSSLRVKG